MSAAVTAQITAREAEQVERANASGRTPVVFIHGLWLLPTSWDRWAELFEEAGYAALTPSWEQVHCDAPRPGSGRHRPRHRHA